MTLTLCFTLTLPALAAELDAVTDQAGLLTEEERRGLNDRAEELAEQYQCALYVVTLDDMGDEDAYEFATELYTEYDLGYGSEKSGLLLLLSMAERDYALIAYGYGNTAFTDYGKDVLLDDHVLPLLGENDYYGGFSAYLETAGEYLSMARDGTPFDVSADPQNGETGGLPGTGIGSGYDETELLPRLAVVILLPLLIAGGLCLYWKSQMKTAVSARTADRYIPENGFQLTGKQDTFLFRTETRRRIEKSSSGGGFSGGTTVGSGGFSGKSGKF